METIIQQIERALDKHLHYLAIAMSLSLPDICAALESPNGETTGAKYKAWYEAWVAPKYPKLSALDAYSLRCGVLHQGRMGHPKMQYARVLFTLPGRSTYHNNIIDDALNLDAAIFCRDIIDAVSKWYAANKGDVNVQANMPLLLQFRADGLAPYLSGIPVIS